MKIIAFDLGSTWACAHNLGSLIVGPPAEHYDLNPQRGKKGALARPAILGQFAQILAQGGPWDDVDLVIHSQPFARGQAATRLLWGMAGVLEAAAHNHGAVVLDVTDSTIKKFATGSGKADKDAMIAAAQFMGYTGDNEHEADAFCLLHYAIANAKEV